MTFQPATNARPPILEVRRYAAARVLDPEGAIIGEVTRFSGDWLELALGGWRDAWGFVDFSSGHRFNVPVSSLAFGPPDAVGMKLVVVPAQRTTTAAR